MNRSFHSQSTNVFAERRQCLPSLLCQQIRRILRVRSHAQPHHLRLSCSLCQLTAEASRPGQWTQIDTDSSNTMGTERTCRGRLCARDHLLGSRQLRIRGRSRWRRVTAAPRREGRIETSSRVGKVLQGRMDLYEPPSLLPHARIAKPLERKQGDQDCTRWNRDRTQHWTASCANVPPTSTSTSRNCRYAASQSSHGSALSCMIALSRARLVYTPNLVRPHNGINLDQDRLGYQCVSEPPSRHRHSTRYIPT